MDYALQVHEAKYIFPVPNGLKELSSDIIREVLRHQPEHINGFIADYLEVMLTVRENARESGIVVCDVFKQGYFFDELFRTKNITREQANQYATVIQAGWRGYVVRRKLSDWLKKKKRFEEEKQRKRSLKIEELLAGLGVTYDEATRAAGFIQAAYKDSKCRRYVSEYGDRMEGLLPFGQRIREGDRALGRFERWEKEDFGDFFEMDECGAIKYVWPRIGQLQKVLREEIPNDAEEVEFFAMRDLVGQEQYSYLIRTKVNKQARGIPIGFLIPLPKSCVLESAPEVEFVHPENIYKMGHYTYIFKSDVEREDLEKFEELLKTRENAPVVSEMLGEFDYDPYWVLPRALIRIKKEFLKETDDEVRFVSLPMVVCEQEIYAFRAETVQQTSKIIRHILRDECLTTEEGLAEAANMSPYKIQETGRIFPVDTFSYPKYIQKIIIQPESSTGEDEAKDLMQYGYIFLPLNHPLRKKFPKGESLMTIPIARFQGYHADYRGSTKLENKVFILGPKISTPDGKPFNYESLFWDEFGQEAWHQLLYDISTKPEEIMGEGEEDESEVIQQYEEEELEVLEEEYYGEKESFGIKESQDLQIDRKPSQESEHSTDLAPVNPEGNEAEKVMPPVEPSTDTEADGEEKLNGANDEGKNLEEEAINKLED